MVGIRRERTLTTPDLVVLGFLMERPMHGYQIVLGLKSRQVKDWAGVSKPQVYYSLKKLESSGLICGDSTSDPSQGPERRIFSVSPKAVRALGDALGSDSWATTRQVPPFSTWAMLSMFADPPTVERVIASRRAFLKQEIDREALTLNGAKADEGVTADFAVSLIGLAIKSFQLELSWLDELEELHLRRREQTPAVPTLA